MKYVVNWYSTDLHAVLENGPPLIGAYLEDHPFGAPPRELRTVWVIELDALETLLPQIQDHSVIVSLSYSAIWSGPNMRNPGAPLFGLSITDDVERSFDPRDRPIHLVQKLALE
jgi:hypothetical protein